MEDLEPITQEDFKEGLEELFPEQQSASPESYAFRYSFLHDVKVHYRYLRKNISYLLREKFQRRFKEILFVTVDDIPYDFISSYRQQYPDKEVRVLLPILDEPKRLIKTHFKFKYYLQNKINTAQVYKYPRTKDNIVVYGIYSEAFSCLENKEDILNIKHLSPFLKCSRIFGKMLRPDVIHSDRIPFFLGSEFEKLRYPIKVFQTVQDLSDEKFEYEPFWAVLNLADKASMKKLCKDKFVKKCVAALFNKQNVDNFHHMKECLEFIYQNYIKFRAEIDKSEIMTENALIERLNARTLKIFPQLLTPYKATYNPFYNGIKCANQWAVLSQTYYNEICAERGLPQSVLERVKDTKDKFTCVSKIPSIEISKIHRSFNKDNFRDRRYKNKQYLTKEFSSDRIKMGFVDRSFFTGEYNIHGYLDSFYDAPLFFGMFSDNVQEDGFDIAVSVILKLFELNKNIQVILNIPGGMKNNYIKSFVDFCEKSPAINGRWLFIDGQINVPQFLASSDMIIIPSRINSDGKLTVEAMKQGCIPIVARNGINNDIVVDIFDNMLGCGFKTEVGLDIVDNPELMYFKTVLKALNFYMQNGSWNLIIKNCLEYKSEWSFEMLEKYNQIYESLIL